MFFLFLVVLVVVIRPIAEAVCVSRSFATEISDELRCIICSEIGSSLRSEPICKALFFLRLDRDLRHMGPSETNVLLCLHVISLVLAMFSFAVMCTVMWMKSTSIGLFEKFPKIFRSFPILQSLVG